MSEYLIAFLKRLEELAPPPPNCHHAITFARYGSDEVGWEDRLALQINQAGVFRCIFLDSDDFAVSANELATATNEYLRGVIAFAEQLGVGFGQYAEAEQ